MGFVRGKWDWEKKWKSNGNLNWNFGYLRVLKLVTRVLKILHGKSCSKYINTRENSKTIPIGWGELKLGGKMKIKWKFELKLRISTCAKDNHARADNSTRETLQKTWKYTTEFKNNLDWLGGIEIGRKKWKSNDNLNWSVGCLRVLKLVTRVLKIHTGNLAENM